MNNKELTIIIVTFNSAEIIEKCLKSFDISKYDVFIIDNNSSDKTVELVKNSFGSTIVIENSKNLGFGRANNIGLNQAQTPFALILNPDVQIRDIDIEICLKHLKNNPQIALASPHTLSSNNFENATISKSKTTNGIRRATNKNKARDTGPRDKTPGDKTKRARWSANKRAIRFTHLGQP